jgi:hypothetical protein
MHHGCHLNALAEAGGTLAASAGPATNEIARDITMPTVAVFLHMSCGRAPVPAIRPEHGL